MKKLVKIRNADGTGTQYLVTDDPRTGMKTVAAAIAEVERIRAMAEEAGSTVTVEDLPEPHDEVGFRDSDESVADLQRERGIRNG